MGHEVKALGPDALYTGDSKSSERYRSSWDPQIYSQFLSNVDGYRVLQVQKTAKAASDKSASGSSDARFLRNKCCGEEFN